MYTSFGNKWSPKTLCMEE